MIRLKTSSLPLYLICALIAGRVAAQQAPHDEKGFRPEKMYSFGSLDHVNTFNGNLVVSIPVGMRYPLDGGFSYGLSLNYNGKVWDIEDWGSFRRSFPGRRPNAGMGWLLTMGRMVEPNDPTNPTNEWLYEAPDGNDHRFAANFLYPGASGCTGSYCGQTWYTHDGSFLRMRVLSANLRTVEGGDGVTSEFELAAGTWRLRRMYNAFRDSAGNPLNYVNVTYPNPGTIAYCPGATFVWHIQDSKGRVHFVCFKDQNVGGNPTSTVDRVVLAGVGQYATYVFEYDLNTSIAESCEDTYVDPLAPPTKFDVPFLRRLKLPDGTDSTCSADDCSRFQFDYSVGGCSSGALQTMTLPTMGRIAYTYGRKNIQVNDPCSAVLALRPVGVSTRTLLDGDGTVLGSWAYDVGPVPKPGGGDYANASCGTGPGGGELHPPIHDEAVSTVLDPAGNKFVQHYNVWPGGGRDYDEVSPDGFRKKEYSLPIGKYDPAVNASLATEMMPGCDSSGNNCASPVRKSYVRYRLDPPDWKAEEAHRTTVAERTVFLDDSTGPGTYRYAHVEYSDYDGFGHYRTATTSGSFEGDDARTSYSNFNPGADLHGLVSGRLAFSTDDPWILGTYDTVTTTDATGSITSRHCFDRTTGWLRAQRAGAQNSVKDLVTLFGPELSGSSATGNLATESYYGGDGSPLNASAASQPICAIASGGNPGSLGYRLVHTYSYGVRATSKYAGMPFFVLDRQIHQTGLTLASRATDGVLVTSYQYDRGGRMLTIAPPEGKATTTYAYTKASTEGGALTPARVRATTVSATGSNVEVEYQYDALGRFWREKQKMPAGTWSVRETKYDALDRKMSVSEMETLPGTGEFTFVPLHKTTFADYDPFGRAHTVSAPDGSITRFAFKGASEATRTVRIATGVGTDTNASTVETYDRHGRLIRVEEPGPGGKIATSYRYDVGNRLSAVEMMGQNRTFDYDSRGFLRWESHPESGMTSYTYDARGHILTKSQSAAMTLFDLTYRYDPAERLIEVRGRNPFFDPAWPDDPDQPEFRLMKHFTYSTVNETGNYLLGKLWIASRYNYDPSSGSGDTYKVSETYRYGDEAGRMNHRITSITHGVGTDESTWQPDRDVVTEVVYNDLNLPGTVKYPSCLDCGTWPGPPGPVRHQAYGYTGGRLTSVPGFLNAVTYWPNGMWNTMSRSNGMTDRQETDPSGMARPASFSAALSDSCTLPSITGDPAGGTVTPSKPVTLSVTVSGTGPFTYEWWNDSSEVASTGPTNSTTSTFTATSTNTPATTRYRVYVSNGCGEVVSIWATVSVGECVAPNSVSASSQPNADGTYTLSAVAAGTEPRTYTWRRTSDQALMGSTRKVTVGPLSKTTTYTVSVANACPGGPATGNVIVSIPTPMAAVLTATRTPNTNRIRVTWTGPTTGVTYTLQRRGGAGGWTDHVTLSAAALSARTYEDSDSVIAGRTYAYRLKNESGQISNADVATTTTFSPAMVGPATVSALNPMLAAVNSVRAAVGWPAVTWENILSSKDPLPAQGARIMSVHVTSARARMNEALQALGAVANAYTPSDVKGATIEARHLNDIMERAY